MTASEIDSLANILWNYLCLSQPIKKTNCIMVLGSDDLQVIENLAY